MVEGVIWLTQLGFYSENTVGETDLRLRREGRPAGLGGQSGSPSGHLGQTATMKGMWSVRTDSLWSGNRLSSTPYPLQGQSNSQSTFVTVMQCPPAAHYSGGECRRLLSLPPILSLVSPPPAGPSTTIVCPEYPDLLINCPSSRCQLRLLTLIGSWELIIQNTSTNAIKTWEGWNLVQTLRESGSIVISVPSHRKNSVLFPFNLKSR